MSFYNLSKFKYYVDIRKYMQEAMFYKSENEFLVILEYVKKGFYKTMSLDFYKEKIILIVINNANNNRKYK